MCSFESSVVPVHFPESNYEYCALRKYTYVVVKEKEKKIGHRAWSVLQNGIVSLRKQLADDSTQVECVSGPYSSLLYVPAIALSSRCVLHIIPRTSTGTMLPKKAGERRWLTWLSDQRDNDFHLLHHRSRLIMMLCNISRVL